MNYADYLKSDHWKITRTEALKYAGNECQLCSIRANLEVHHNKYINLWHETHRDLIVLCHDCHSKFHAAPPPEDIRPEQEPEPSRIPRQIDEIDFAEIKQLWIDEQAVVLAAQALIITEDQRRERIAEIRSKIDAIKYEAL